MSASAWLRWDVVARVLGDGELGSVLEIGCGMGGFAARLAGRGQYLGVESDEVSARAAADRLREVGRGEVRQGTVDDVVEPGRTFDLVCAFEVLEHLEDDRAALASWTRRLAPGGRLLISTPARPELFGADDELAGHYRRYDAEPLGELLRDAGLRDVSVTVYGGPLGYGLKRAREVVARRRIVRGPTSMAERTSGSGRLLQPPPALALVTQAGTAPFRLAQRRWPGRGTGLVAVGRH